MARTVFILIVVVLLAPRTLSFPSTTTISSLLSLSHSLTSRIAALRSSRGDLTGATRARLIAGKIQRLQGIGAWKLAWSVGWDYARNYAWRGVDYGELYGSVKDVNDLLRAFGELTRLTSDAERVLWVKTNYGRLLTVSKNMFARMLRVFRKSGALRDLVETVQREVVEGDLLRDCFELGSNDMKGLLQIIKDFALQFSSNAQDNFNQNEL